jgi:1-acyl-sn-glycerol-3-phosphate acyltransferase
MLRFLPAPVAGAIILIVGCSGTLVLFLFPVLPLAILKLLVPLRAWRDFWTRPLIWGTTVWARWVTLCIGQAQQPAWDIQGLDQLRPDGKYLLISNHSAWTDIPVLLKIFPGHLPFPRFFMKQQLIWLPIIGFCAWAIDCPFMRRHTKDELEKHPEWRGRDVETTRRSCDKLRHLPATIVNFAEGTRMTEEKRVARGSPYKNLLRPKSAGIALVLNCMGEQFDAILDMTIAYPPGVDTSFWAYVCGRVPEISVRIDKLPVPKDLIGGDYQNDSAFQRRFQEWVTALWDRKERLIDELHAGARARGTN